MTDIENEDTSYVDTQELGLALLYISKDMIRLQESLQYLAERASKVEALLKAQLEKHNEGLLIKVTDPRLNLSNRSVNALSQSFYVLADIVELPAWKFQRKPGIGPATYKEVKAALEALGLKFNMKVPSIIL